MTRTYSLLLSITLSLITAPAWAVTTEEAIQSCTTIANDGERLACYDAIGRSISQSDEPAVESNVAAKSGMDDTLGGKQFEKPKAMDESLGGARFEQQEQGDEPLSTGRVTFCQKSYDDKWLFVFEGGQVWKQVRVKKRKFKNCDFMANIGKDFFGYYLMPEGDDQKTRIERLK